MNFIQAEKDEAQKLLADGEIEVVLKLDEDFADKLEAQLPAQVTVVYDEMSTNSQAKASAIMQMIELYNTRVGYERRFS